MSSIQVFDRQGNKQESVSIALSAGIQEMSGKVCNQAIRVLMQNWRQGTVGVKERSDVAFSNKKPWRQKGTGRARASSRRSPLWRKGGVTFGPQPRVRKLAINKKQRSGVLGGVFAQFANSGNINCFDLAFDEKPSTKMAAQALKHAGIENKKVLVFTTFDDDMARLSFGNIPNVCVASFDEPNAYVCASSSKWVFLKKDLEHFKRMVERWS